MGPCPAIQIIKVSIFIPPRRRRTRQLGRGNFRGSHITYGGLMTIRKENIHAALTDLATRYPRAFALEKYRPHRPLKVGVAADILACCPDLDRRKLGVALAAYTRRVMY